jgi:hypothetical protein
VGEPAREDGFFELLLDLCTRPVDRARFEARI